MLDKEETVEPIQSKKVEIQIYVLCSHQNTENKRAWAYHLSKNTCQTSDDIPFLLLKFLHPYFVISLVSTYSHMSGKHWTTD